VYWFGPIIGGVCGGAFYDMIYSTKSSFSRIRSCMLVFHPANDDAAAGAASPRTDVEKAGDVQSEQTGGEPGLVEVEYSGEPKGDTSNAADSKPRRGMV
jgi:hypothetical protein